VTIGGYVGTGAIVPNSLNGANINQHIARISLRENDADPYFYWSFIESLVGTILLTRWVSGTVQTGINLNDLKCLPIPWPDIGVQRAIGNKVRKAERLRETAIRAEVEAKAFARRYTPIAIPSVNDEPLWTISSILSTDSLGPEYNRAIKGHLVIRESLTLSSLTESCKCGEPIRADQRGSGYYLYYGASGPIDSHSTWNFEGEYLIVAQDGSIGHACVANGHFWANNHVWVLKVKPEYSPYSIAYYLENLYPYWSGLTTGSVVPKVTAENLMKIVIPKAIATAHEEMGAKLAYSSVLREEIAFLIKSAKSDVEALISSTLDEEKLLSDGQEIERWLEANPSLHDGSDT
jgi:type I restriction enzyme S subunit